MSALASSRHATRLLFNEILTEYQDWTGEPPEPQVELASMDRHVSLTEALKLCRSDAVLPRASYRILKNLGVPLEERGSYRAAVKSLQQAIRANLMEV
jgi:hypothetical protein